MTEPMKRRGSRRKKWNIQIIPISPDKYPAFQKDPDHQFIGMSPEQRNKEITECCARIWAETKKSERSGPEKKD
jgi:hypothetical protein